MFAHARVLTDRFCCRDPCLLPRVHPIAPLFQHPRNKCLPVASCILKWYTLKILEYIYNLLAANHKIHGKSQGEIILYKFKKHSCPPHPPPPSSPNHPQKCNLEKSSSYPRLEYVLWLCILHVPPPGPHESNNKAWIYPSVKKLNKEGWGWVMPETCAILPYYTWQFVQYITTCTASPKKKRLFRSGFSLVTYIHYISTIIISPEIE